MGISAFLYLLSSEPIVRCRYSGWEWFILSSHPGSNLRHWPPGTNSSNVRAVFFCPATARSGVLSRSGAGGPAESLRQAWQLQLTARRSPNQARIKGCSRPSQGRVPTVGSLAGFRLVGSGVARWGRHGFDGIVCGKEACRGVGTRNRSQNKSCQR